MQTNSSRNLSEIIGRISTQAGIPIGKKAVHDLLFYFKELHTWSRVTNLTGIKDPETLVIKHLGDTLLLISHIPKDVRTVLDIGTGAGIPGLLMKLIRPELYIVLAEAVKKKCSFLHFIIASLGLREIFIEEKLISPQNPPEHLPEKGFDLIVSQAAGSVKWFAETGSDFLIPSGSMILLKGPSGEQELERYSEFLNKKGLSHTTARGHLPVAGHQRLLIRLKKKSKPPIT